MYLISWIDVYGEPRLKLVENKENLDSTVLSLTVDGHDFLVYEAKQVKVEVDVRIEA